MHMKRISTEAIDEIFGNKERFPVSNYFAFALQMAVRQTEDTPDGEDVNNNKEIVDYLFEMLSRSYELESMIDIDSLEIV